MTQAMNNFMQPVVVCLQMKHQQRDLGWMLTAKEEKVWDVIPSRHEPNFPSN